jgi:hypothetical protein
LFWNYFLGIALKLAAILVIVPPIGVMVKLPVRVFASAAVMVNS